MTEHYLHSPEGWYDAFKKTQSFYLSAVVRGDNAIEKNKELRKDNKSLRSIERAALLYCEAASEGLPAAKLDKLFLQLVEALKGEE